MLISGLVLGAQHIAGPQSIQSKKKLRGVAQLFTKLPRARIGALDFESRISFKSYKRGTEGQLEVQFLLKTLGSFLKFLNEVNCRIEIIDCLSRCRPLNGLLA